jgi:hypothetical protein
VELGGDVVESVIGQGASNWVPVLLVEPAEGGEGLDGLGGFILRIVGNAHSVWPLVQGKGGWVLSGAYTGIKAPVDGPVAEVGQGHPQGPTRKEGGGGGYSCETDDVAQFAVATILGVVTIMAMPEIAGVLVGSAALNYFLGYSIMGQIAWGAGRLLVVGGCNELAALQHSRLFHTYCCFDWDDPASQSQVSGQGDA